MACTWHETSRRLATGAWGQGAGGRGQGPGFCRRLEVSSRASRAALGGHFVLATLDTLGELEHMLASLWALARCLVLRHLLACAHECKGSDMHTHVHVHVHVYACICTHERQGSDVESQRVRGELCARDGFTRPPPPLPILPPSLLSLPSRSLPSLSLLSKSPPGLRPLTHPLPCRIWSSAQTSSGARRPWGTRPSPTPSLSSLPP